MKYSTIIDFMRMLCVPFSPVFKIYKGEKYIVRLNSTKQLTSKENPFIS